MTTRFLTAALMLSATCVAHADVVPATPTSTDASFLSSWTTGNGSDVAGSGVLNNSSLIGGVAYGGSGDSTQALFDKASSIVDQNGTSVQLTYAKGIQGTYVLGTSNNILAAILGNGISVVGSGTGVTVRQAQQTGVRSDAAGTASGSTGGSASQGSVTVGTQLAATTGGAGTDATASGSSGGTTTTTTTTSTTTTSTTATDSVLLSATSPVQLTASPALVQVAAVLPAAADVPEPSSIALLAAGLFGVAGLRRRRAK